MDARPFFPKAIFLVFLVSIVLLLVKVPPCLAIKDVHLDQLTFQNLIKPQKYDLDQMLKKRTIRVLVVYSKTNYFLDGPRPRGLVYEMLRQFEKQINEFAYAKGLVKPPLEVHVVAIPVSRDQLLPYLEEGKADIAVANLTITPQRQERIDFSMPMADEVKEVVVTSGESPTVYSLEDLAGKEVWVRSSSSYRESLEKLNKELAPKNLQPVHIKPVNENLETEDILEMVNANLIPMTIADNYLANFWKQIFSHIQVYSEIPIKEESQLAWAVRKNCPQLLEAVNEFVRKSRKGTLLGNILIKRYLKNTSWAKKALARENLTRFNQTVDIFRRFASQYDFDYLMMTAVGYQESGLDQSKRSPAGAIGVMQLLKGTAANEPINIPDIEKIDRNIHAGVKYLRHIYDTYFADSDMDELDKMLFTFASYNAGPSRIASIRKKASLMRLNPDVWFGNVEVAAARYIGRETVHYVSNIFKYYMAYTQIASQESERERLKTHYGDKPSP
ncbi:MAG: transporter substrate-binding domain-containing protein [Thermodesulfobacteriota bacterium]